MQEILIEKKEHIAIVTLNRPEKLNAFNSHMLKEFEQTLDALKFSKDIRVIIITGSGKRAFSTGADLQERRMMTNLQVKKTVHHIRSVFQKVAELPQPTIAAVNGYAIGGGFELMLACDLRVASKEAVMGLTETSLAIIPGAGGTQRLPRLIGEMRAKELIFTARKITAVEAFEYGILTKVVAKEEVLITAFSLATQIANNGPIAIQQAKFAINQGMNTDLKTGLEIEGKAYEGTIQTNDRLEALRAFQEKRKPKFSGE